MTRACNRRWRAAGFPLAWLAVGLAGVLPASGAVMADQSVPARPYRVVLLGASIGRAWNLPAFPERMHDRNYVIESFAVWQFDKSAMLDEVLMRPARKFHPTRTYLKSLFQAAPQPPDAIILKECSAYFPGDPAKQKALVQKWVGEASRAHIQPILTTAVPVTRRRAGVDQGKMEALREYNDWIRNYASNRRLPLLDLEAALRTDSRERYLRDDLTSGDGSHLNARAYEILDRLLQETLAGIRKSDADRHIVKE